MANEYLQVEEFKHAAELTGTTFGDLEASQAISAASRAVDEYTGRRFYADADATSVRYYTPTEPRYLNIDDLITLGTVQTDSDGDGVFENTWVENTDFVLDPLNADSDGKPFEEIRVHPRGQFWLPCFPRSVKVTGQFGWSAVPPTIKEAASILAVRLFLRKRQAPFGVVGVGGDNIAVRLSKTDPDVAMLLDPFVRGSGVLAA